jgi:uncharacterized repeat protein (TIGR03803 family)
MRTDVTTLRCERARLGLAFKDVWRNLGDTSTDRRRCAHLRILLAAAIVALVAPATAQPALTVLHVFTGTDGSLPTASLVQATDGNLYGTTGSGGTSNFGTIFKMTSSGTVTVLYSFAGGTGPPS